MIAARTTVMPTLTIGADPELFLVDVNGKFISAVGLIGGTKDKPRPVGNGVAVQEDNVAVEFCIAPATKVEEFIASCEFALTYLSKYVMDKGLFLSITASKSFDEDQLKNRTAQRFGCDPDFNAWTGKTNPAPQASDPHLRSAGGHIHIGYDGLDKLQLGRWCDITMGLHSVLEDSDTARRELYGKAGAYRPKPYGIEYRTLSCYWLQSQELMKKVYERASEAVERVKSGWALDANTDGVAIQNVINNSDKKEAERLIGVYGV